MTSRCIAALIVAASSLTVHAQTAPLRSSAKHDAERVTKSAGLPAATEDEVTLRAKLTEADPARRGEVWLLFSADTAGPTPARLTLKIPLSSTEDVYGESRSCKIAPGAAPEVTFTAGMDEKNFMSFAASGTDREIHLLLNKYLCRALAAPFHCDGKEVALPDDWSRWRLGSSTTLLLSSDAPATLTASRVALTQTGKRFDPASCAVIAPSNGMCCVAHKTTEWHCGGSPAGPGWHQVSGECFHRETGGACTDQTIFPPMQSLK